MRLPRIFASDMLILIVGPVVSAALAAFSNSPEKVFLSVGAMFWGLYFSYAFLFGTKKEDSEKYWDNPAWAHVLILFFIGVTGQVGVEFSRCLLGAPFQVTNVLTLALLASLTALFFKFIVRLSRGMRKH